MPKQDPNPLPYGALQYYQVHFIVQLESDENDEFLARCEPITKGYFGSKRVIAVRWTGASKFTDLLQSDDRLTEMLKDAILQEGEIRIDPQDDHIRIYGSWKHEDKFSFNGTMLEVADRIAMLMKKFHSPSAQA